MLNRPLKVTLIGFGAIGQALCRRLRGEALIHVTHVVVRPGRVTEVKMALDALYASSPATVAPTGAPGAVSEVPAGTRLALECAGHDAVIHHVLPALARGVECAVLSVGALAEPGLPERLADAAQVGNTQVHLLSGAMGGIEALAAAKLAGLTQVTYTGRKPPAAWGPVASTPGQTPATPPKKVKKTALTPFSQENSPLAPVSIENIATILDSTAREAARLYPKNANVAATVALAGLGLDATRVRLLADPSVTENIHEIHATGAFGEMRLEMRGKPLADNPKTSALTVLSALRFLHNRASVMTI